MVGLGGSQEGDRDLSGNGRQFLPVGHGDKGVIGYGPGRHQESEVDSSRSSRSPERLLPPDNTRRPRRRWLHLHSRTRLSVLVFDGSHRLIEILAYFRIISEPYLLVSNGDDSTDGAFTEIDVILDRLT